MIGQQNEPLNDEQKEGIWRVLKDADERLNISYLIIPNLQVIAIADSQYYSFKEYLKQYYIQVWAKESFEETSNGMDMFVKPYDIRIDWRSLGMIGGLSSVVKEADDDRTIN